MPTASVRYLDVVGVTRYKENVLLEVSGGIIKENVAHTRDDTVKLITAATEVLKAQAAQHQDSKFSTFQFESFLA